MANYLDIKWLLRCEAQLRDMCDDVVYARLIVQELDSDPALKAQLEQVYHRAQKTLELVGKERGQHFPQ